MDEKTAAVIAEPSVARRAPAPAGAARGRSRSPALLPFIAAAVPVAAWQIPAQVFPPPI